MCLFHIVAVVTVSAVIFLCSFIIIFYQITVKCNSHSISVLWSICYRNGKLSQKQRFDHDRCLGNRTCSHCNLYITLCGEFSSTLFTYHLVYMWASVIKMAK